MKGGDKKLKRGERVMVSGGGTNNPATVVDAKGLIVMVRYDNSIKGAQIARPVPVKLSRVERMK